MNVTLLTFLISIVLCVCPPVWGEENKVPIKNAAETLNREQILDLAPLPDELGLDILVLFSDDAVSEWGEWRKYGLQILDERSLTVIRQKLLRGKIQRLRDAIRSAPDDKSLHRQLSEALGAAGDNDGSSMELKLSGNSVPKSTDSLLNEGNSYFLRKDFPAAIRVYNDAARRVGTSEVYQKLGDAYQAVGNDTDALGSYRKSVRIAPNYAKGYFSIGSILERRRDFNGAIEAYEHSASLDETKEEVHSRLAEMYAYKGHLSKAITEYNKVLDVAPDKTAVYVRLAKAYRRGGHFDKAAKFLETAVKLSPTDLDLKRELIRLEIRRNKLQNAEKQCRAILAINRDDQRERKRLIGILGRQKKYDELVQFLTEETVRYPNDGANFYRIGIVKEYLKDYRSAVTALQKSIEIKASAQSYLVLARVCLNIPNVHKAREALTKANHLDPKRQDIPKLIELIDDEYGHSDSEIVGKNPEKIRK